ncbi:hypothetical protein, partial [Streptomyces sp. XY37]|uniref:hypothetical protein n=1 Tax=Streptomyces sp. XY37 TaxID=1519478 RepID=UPI003B64113C
VHAHAHQPPVHRPEQARPEHAQQYGRAGGLEPGAHPYADGEDRGDQQDDGAPAGEPPHRSGGLMGSRMVPNVLMHTDGDALLVAEAVGELGERRLRVEVA